MLTFSLIYLPEHLCSTLVWFIFWSIYAHPKLGLSSGASMLNLCLVYLLEHLCSSLVWFIFWSIYAQLLVEFVLLYHWYSV
jgi:hypothetical protein